MPRSNLPFRDVGYFKLVLPFFLNFILKQKTQGETPIVPPVPKRGETEGRAREGAAVAGGHSGGRPCCDGQGEPREALSIQVPVSRR